MQVATDIDPLAVHATEANIALNHFADRSQVVLAEPFLADAEPLQEAGITSSRGGFDVLLANILKPALLDLQPRLCGYVRAGGTLVLSGLLTSQVCLPVNLLWSTDVQLRLHFLLFRQHSADHVDHGPT